MEQKKHSETLKESERQKLRQTRKSRLEEVAGQSKAQLQALHSQHSGLKSHDQYEGALDPVSKRRQGQGVYHYNSFFEYEGSWEQNQKHGLVQLRLANGTVYRGVFKEGEMEGQFEVKYWDGAVYKGLLSQGQRSGYGVLKTSYFEYAGEFKDSLFEGAGEYKDAFHRIVGQFEANQPSGSCEVWDSLGNKFKGTLKAGVREGRGSLRSEECCFQYEGDFAEGKLQGKGLYKSLFTPYEYAGDFLADRPAVLPNRIAAEFQLVSKSGETDRGAKAVVDFELQEHVLSLWISLQYEGPEELDPVQPTPQEIEELTASWQKQNKKTKNPPPMPDFHAPRMKKPAPRLVKEESGRKLKVTLENEAGKKLRVDYRKLIAARRAEIERLKAQSQKQVEEQAVVPEPKKKEPKKKESKAPAEIDQRILLFREDDRAPLHGITAHGQIGVERLEFPEDMPPGKYCLQISDASGCRFGTCRELRVELNLCPRGGGDKKKKK